MTLTRRARRLLIAFLLYSTFCTIAGISLANGALHPARRPLSDPDLAEARNKLREENTTLTDVSITTPDNTTLRAWLLKPNYTSGNAAIVLHGLGDNRLGMVGYANLLLAHGYTVLLPDARAHGTSGGQFATYGLLERNDIHQWLDFLDSAVHPACIFGLGESMGAAQLLQSLDTHPKICAAVAESSFANFREIAYDRMGQPFHTGPWLGRTLLRPIVEIAFLRARWKYGLAMWRISPEDAIRQSSVPVLLIHGAIDTNIPVRHSRIIHLYAPQTVLWEVRNADHCGAFRTQPKEFENRVLDWFSPKQQNATSQKISN